MVEHPDCNAVTWKIGFASGAYGSVNVRSQPDINSSRIDILRSKERKIVEWSEDGAMNDVWYPVRIHVEYAVDAIKGWVHSDYAVFNEIPACKQPVIPDAGDMKRFVDTPIPGYPTMVLNGLERQHMGNYFYWLSLYILNGPYEFEETGDVDLDQLHAAIQQLDATIRLAKMLPPHEPSPQEDEGE